MLVSSRIVFIFAVTCFAGHWHIALTICDVLTKTYRTFVSIDAVNLSWTSMEECAMYLHDFSFHLFYLE